MPIQEIQELSYLRSEMNQRISFCYDYSDKIMKHMFVIWSGIGTLFLYGIAKEGHFFTMQNVNHIMKATFIFVIILFISNLYLYLASLKYSENIRQICELASYIAVFYEMRIGKDRKDSDNSWEIASFEAGVKRNEKSNTKAKKLEILRSWHVMDDEYTLMAIVSTLIILIILILSSIYTQDLNELAIRIFIFNIVVFCISIILIYKIYKNSSLALRNMIKEKAERMGIFLDYAIKNEYYTEDCVKKRFGDFLKIIDYKMPSERVGSHRSSK
jgi:hypothetical protein